MGTMEAEFSGLRAGYGVQQAAVTFWRVNRLVIQNGLENPSGQMGLHVI